MTLLFGAIDVGASSGRVIAGMFPEGKLQMFEVHRFGNQPVEKDGRLFWDFETLHHEIQKGLRELGSFAEELGLDVTSVGIDTWAVDYGIVRDGELLASPGCYRDPLNRIGTERVHGLESFDRLYEVTGIQYLQINTIYQISKNLLLDYDLLMEATDILMIPDLIGYFLTGEKRTEITNASTTGLLDARSRTWSGELAQKLGLESVINKFGTLAQPGTIVGTVLPGYGPRLSLTDLVLVASHDTASAVVGVPATEEDFVFISSGTWSLLGTELKSPILSSDANRANFTNELGADGRVRFLKNLGGLWLLNESLRHFEATGQNSNLQNLLEEAAHIQPGALFNVEDEAFLEPGDMPSRISRQLRNAGKVVPDSPAGFVAVILHSLAKSYAENLTLLESVTGKSFTKLHVIGGGSQNELLNQLTADSTGLTVIAGPVEATAMGNLLIQYRAAENPDLALEDLRQIIINSDVGLKTYSPKQR
jgi:rhamnulokinase